MVDFILQIHTQTSPSSHLQKPPRNFVRCACKDLRIMGICTLYVHLGYTTYKV